MDFSALHKTQWELDEMINDIKGLSGQDLMQERILALEVEIGELANETRCFKFWSAKPPSEKSVILEELVDCLHFLLSIGNYSGYSFSLDARNVNINDDLEGSVTELFIGFFHSVVDFSNNVLPAGYVRMWDYLMSIAKKLEFTRQDLYKGYMMKNKINHQRQAEGY